MARRRPGIAAVGVMSLLVALAHGVPGGATPPSQQYVDDALRARLKADQIITIVGDPVAGELPPSQRPSTRGRTGRHRRAFVRDYRAIALREARRSGIRHPQLFVRQIAAESGMQPCARSGAGAIGIAQIMPATARAWHVDPWMPEQALRVAAVHMALYERRYGSYRLALAAYNAGPAAVRDAGGIPPYAETRGYVRRVTDRGERLPGLRHVFRVDPGLRTGFGRRLSRLQRAVRRHGGRISIESGWRSYEEQVTLYRAAKRRYGGWRAASIWVAPPGCSNHNRGYAADITGSIALAHRLAPRFGLMFPMAHEPWHIEPAHIPGVR